MKVFLILAFLQIACNHTSNFITKDYQNVKLTADHFVISISDLNILNKKDIKNSFGGDNPDSCFINFFKEDFPKFLESYANFIEIYIEPVPDNLELIPTDLPSDDSQTIEINVPIDGYLIQFPNVRAEFVLLLDELNIHRYTDYPPKYLNPYFLDFDDSLSNIQSGTTPKALIFDIKYMIWDNRFGKLISYGQFSIGSSFLFSISKSNWESINKKLAMTIIKGSPFDKYKIVDTEIKNRSFVTEIKKMISSGADINVRNPKLGSTPLIVASLRGDIESVKLLLNNSANPNVQDDIYGTTALMAASRVSEEIVGILLENGADPNIKRLKGTTAFSECILGIINKRVDIDLAALFLSNGANIDEAPNSGGTLGYTSLMIAVRNNNLDLVNFLVSHGANVNIRAGDGSTAFEIATKNDNKEILDVLKKVGADE